MATVEAAASALMQASADATSSPQQAVPLAIESATGVRVVVLPDSHFVLVEPI